MCFPTEVWKSISTFLRIQCCCCTQNIVSHLLRRKLHSWTSKQIDRSRWTGTSCFVLEFSLCNLRSSTWDFVPCDRNVQRTYSKLLRIHGILEVSDLTWCPFQESCKSSTCEINVMILILLWALVSYERTYMIHNHIKRCSKCHDKKHPQQKNLKEVNGIK